jgi:glucan phosphorylase
MVFLPEYDASLAERLIPGSEVSQPISTAGYEASGTSKMKFMVNRVLTVGMCDGATIEMTAAAGQEKFLAVGSHSAASCPCSWNDRTMVEYATEIWNVKPCQVP